MSKSGITTLAVIPARGGSKRIARKNIRPFCGKPIIAYSIEAAIESNLFDHVIVSTDDEEIAEIAKQHGAEIPFMRPAKLADDHTGTNAIAKHAIEWYRNNGSNIDYTCCIYATAPMLQANYLKQGFYQLQTNNTEYAFAVTTYDFPVQRALTITETGTIEALDDNAIAMRSQDLKECVHDAGQFYWGKSNAFVNELPLMSDHASAVILPRYRAQDIDTEEDWLQAELMYKALATQ